MSWFNEKHPPTKLVKQEGFKGFMPFFPPSKPISCLYCGESISLKGEGVYWNGCLALGGLADELRLDAGYIFLHTQCAIKLAAHLSKDALLAEGKEYLYGK